MLRVRMPPELKKRAEVAAAAAGMTLTGWVQQLLDSAAPPVPQTLDGSEPARRRPRRDTRPCVPGRDGELSMTG